jgi:hypothetical protein
MSQVTNFKNTPKDLVIEEQVKRFIHYLGIDRNVQEVNFDYQSITYKANGCDITITFKAK